MIILKEFLYFICTWFNVHVINNHHVYRGTFLPLLYILHHNNNNNDDDNTYNISLHR